MPDVKFIEYIKSLSYTTKLRIRTGSTCLSDAQSPAYEAVLKKYSSVVDRECFEVFAPSIYLSNMDG